MTTPYPQPGAPQPNQPQNGQQQPPRQPAQQVQYRLGTAKLNKKFGAAGTVVWIIIGVVVAGGLIVSVVTQSIVPGALAAVAGVMVILRRFARPRRTGVIGKQAMGSITIGTQGIAIANVQGTANVFPWEEIEAIGVLSWKENIAFRSRSPRIAQLLPPMRPGVPVYLPISIIYIEAPREEVVAALQHFAGPRFAGVGLEKDALAR